MKRLLQFLRDEDGPTSVEYAVMLALIVGTCIGAITFFGSEAGGSFEHSSDELETYMNGG